MRLIKLAAATLNQMPMTWDANQKNILSAIAAAREAKAAILCLPELCISGYGCEDAFAGAGVLAQARRVLHELAPVSAGMIISLGLPLLHQNRVYNSVCLLADGHIAGFVAKRFLPGDGIHYEPRWFHPWPAGVRDEIELSPSKQRYPIGDIYFDCGGVRIGFEICEEAWVAKRPGIALAQQGVDVILNPSASHFAFEKRDIRRRFVLEGSRAFSVSYIYTNLLGNEAGRVIYDGDRVIASGGKMLASGTRFSFANWRLTCAVADIHLTRMAQARTSRFVPNPASCVSAPFTFPELRPCEAGAFGTVPERAAEKTSTWEESAKLKEEEFARAVSLGLFDYLRKSRSHGFVLSLSGGADSAAIACLVRLMVELGVKELGMARFQAKLARPFTEETEISGLVRRLLACAYQATKNSSKITRDAARAVAEAIGADFMELDIEHLVKGYVDLIAAGTGHELTWEQDDLALQNIQARARSPGIWLLANIRNALLLATGNRSEAAVGYTTMDGDSSGGLSPLAGIDKDFLRQWLCWLEQEGLEGIGPIPALSAINCQHPTAELRPGKEQTDEEDLMPYPLLNAIEIAAIRDRQTPYEIFCLLQSRFRKYGPEQLLVWIERFFQLWSRNQWKRERLAPGFHLDDESLDPKTWCRFPILSGSFEHELADMRARVAERI
ncbi:MAG: NAD(+) synthase [Gammaproteobacteria bacterium]|nr:NAD(+) synthase [Gammaproteobacteria bacterium]